MPCKYCGGETEPGYKYCSDVCYNLYWQRYKERNLAQYGRRPTAMGAWEYISSWVRAFAGGRCEKCNRDKAQIYFDKCKMEGKAQNKFYRNFFEPFEIHHIIPISHGGNSSIDNLVLLCKECHLEAHRILRIQEKIRKRREKTLTDYPGDNEDAKKILV